MEATTKYILVGGNLELPRDLQDAVDGHGPPSQEYVSLREKYKPAVWIRISVPLALLGLSINIALSKGLIVAAAVTIAAIAGYLVLGVLFRWIYVRYFISRALAKCRHDRRNDLR